MMKPTIKPVVTPVVREALHLICASGRRLALAIVVNLLLCAGLFLLFEGADPFESLYWAVTTGTTTGYGDLSPATLPGRLVTMWLMVSSVGFVALSTAMLAAMLVQDPHLFSHEEQEELMDDVDDVHAMLFAICDHLGIEVPESVEEYHRRSEA